MQTDLVRIYNNIQTLLAEGTFPGKFGAVVHEALQHVSSMITRLEQDSGQEAGTDGSSVGNASDAAGLASSEVQPAVRKGRGRKGK